jgi:septal ring factor EnvC (AmiA/AmiB activator)
MSLSLKNIMFLLWMLVGLNVVTYPQSKEELENKKAALQEEINYINELKKQTDRNKKLSLNQMITLNKKINIREELISTIGKELNKIDVLIDETQYNINSLQKDLEKLKTEYAKMIYSAYKTKSSYDKLMFMMAAEDFNQAYIRLKYFQQFAEFRRSQANLIVQTQKSLKEKSEELAEKKQTKQHLLSEKEKEKQELSKEKEEQVEVLNNLKTKENDLKKQLKKKQQDAEKLQKAIEDLIAEEIKKAKAKSKGSSSGKTYALTPEELKLSTSFTSNKGKLPWPCERGIISASFGEHPHPVLQGIKVKNNGIDISTHEGAGARAAFDGEVTGVISIPGAGKAVILSHGEYRTVYSNLNEVFVKTGDKVKTKQSIGNIITDSSDSKTELHFEVWKWDQLQDPKLWLYPKN